MAVAGLAHDLDLHVVRGVQGLGASACVGLVGVKMFELGQFGAGLGRHGCSAVAVLHTGRCDGHGQQQPQGVHHQMALAAFDLLACIEAALAALGGRSPWTANPAPPRWWGSRCKRLAPLLHGQAIMHDLDTPLSAQRLMRLVHGGPGGKRGGQSHPRPLPRAAPCKCKRQKNPTGSSGGATAPARPSRRRPGACQQTVRYSHLEHCRF